MKIDITALFVCVDDFCKLHQKALKAYTLPQAKKRNRSGYIEGVKIFV